MLGYISLDDLFMLVVDNNCCAGQTDPSGGPQEERSIKRILFYSTNHNLPIKINYDDYCLFFCLRVI